ncbi:hypothetical protein SAURM35S_05642 [Streptomyces aurantiogriseus]
MIGHPGVIAFLVTEEVVGGNEHRRALRWVLGGIPGDGYASVGPRGGAASGSGGNVAVDQISQRRRGSVSRTVWPADPDQMCSDDQIGKKVAIRARLACTDGGWPTHQTLIDAVLQGKKNGQVGFGHTRALAVVVQAGSAGSRSTVHIRHKSPALSRVQPASGAVCDQPLTLCIRRPIWRTPTTRARVGEEGAVPDTGIRDGKMPAQFPGTAIESLDGTSVPGKTGGTVLTGNAGSPRLPRGRGVAAAVDPNGCQGRVDGSKGRHRQCVGLLHVQAGGCGE